jgi:hypothetical protein
MTLFEIEIVEGLKVLLDYTAVGTLFAVLTSALPVIASLLTVVWMGYRVLEEHEKRKERKGK